MVLSQETKLEILHSVKEDVLRKEVLIPIFRNMGDYIDVIDNHGANEQGTDIVLIEQGPLDDYIYTSIVLKAQSINNATTGGNTAANVIQQVILANNSGYNCTIQGRKVKFNFIKVVTSKTISNTARDNLIDVSVPVAVSCMTDADIIPLIDKHLPKFYFYTSGMHADYADAVQRKYEKLNELTNIPLQSMSVDERAFIDVYVKPRLRKINTKKIQGIKTRKDTVISFPEEVLINNNRILIVGEAGSGKSLILRDFVLEVLASNTRNASTQIPVLVKANEIAKSSLQSLLQILNNIIVNDYNIPAFDISSLVDGRLILLVDGMDEIIEADDRSRVKTLVNKFCKNHPNIKVVVTSRLTKDISTNGFSSVFHRWDIMPFNNTQVRNFIEKWFINNGTVGNRLLTALEDHNLLSRLPNTPLVLTLLAILHSSDDYREIPSNLSELYQMFTDLLLGKWNLDRQVETMYQANVREHVLQEISYFMHMGGKQSITIDEFEMIIRDCYDDLGVELDSSALMVDFTDQTGLMFQNDHDELEFRHLSFQEFFVAQQFFSEVSDEKIAFLVDRLESRWWSNVLYFFCGLRQKNADLLSNAMERIIDLSDFEQLISLIDFGYLIQSSYRTSIELRIEFVELALRTFYQNIDLIDEVNIGDKNIPSGMIFSILTMWLTNQYSSSILSGHYRELYKTLLSEKQIEGETGFVLLSLALFLAARDEFDLLGSTYHYIKPNPKQMLALDILGEGLMEDMTTDERRDSDVRKLRESLKQVKKWFKEHPDITKALTTSTPTLST